MMQMLRTKLVNWLTKDTASLQFKEGGSIKLPTNDVGWSDVSVVYTSKDFQKYNPDDLIGRKGYGIYKRMMCDEQVKAVVKFKRDAITAKDWYFTIDKAENVLSDDEIEFRIALFYHIIDKMKGSLMDALNGIMSALYNGYSMTEKVFANIEYEGLTYWGIDKLKLKPFDTFYFSVDEYGNIDKLKQKFGSKEQDVDIRKFIHFVMNPDNDEHYGGSELREAYRAWFSKDIIIKFRNMWLERHAGGFRYMQAKEGKILTTAETTNLQNILANIGVTTSMVLPSTVEYGSEYPNNNVAYFTAEQACDTSIARALLVPNLLGVSPQGDTGSYSQSKSQIEAFLWTLKADTMRLEEALNEQLFRQLGEANFGDDYWPKFKFKPASGERIHDLVKTWKELVQGGAVRATDTDEAHLRELLEFPEAGEEIKKQPIPEVIVQPKSDNADETEKDDESSKDIGESEEEPTDKAPKDAEEELSAKGCCDHGDSTIVGKGLINVIAFNKAMRRCDFAVIDKTSETLVQEYKEKVVSVVDIITQDLIEKFKEEGDVETGTKDNIKALKVDSKLKQKLNSTISSGLNEGYALGQKHAALEIRKAKQKEEKVNYERIELTAKEYLKVAAYKATGDIIGRITSIIEQEILNGVRYNKSLEEIEQTVYDRLASRGLMSEERHTQVLKDRGEKVNNAAEDVNKPDHSIESSVRTMLFDSINESRYEYFTDESLDNFVEGFLYSAILDSRTTEICRSLDGKEKPVSWWDDSGYKPPNHSNCRSLLIPITILDEFKESEGEPKIKPQEGYS